MKPTPEEKKCAACGSTERVRLVYPRRAWGHNGQSYWPARLWCFDCCKRNNGAYALASSGKARGLVRI